VLAVLAAIAGLSVRPALDRLGRHRSQIATRAGDAPVPIAPRAAGAPLDEARRQAMLRAGPVLDWADAQSLIAIDQHVRLLDQFFRDAKRRTPAFASDVLSFSSKWRLVADRMPFARKQRYAAYVRDRFSQRVFSPEQVAQALNQVARSYVDSQSGIENEMLVRLRADVHDLPAGAVAGFEDPARLQAAFEQALARADDRVHADLRSDLSRETVSFLLCTAAQTGLVRLGVSAGILTAGAASSWETFGVGLVACVIVDQVVTCVWNWCRDPVGDLSGTVNAKLTELNVLLVQGDAGRPGLRATLLEFARRRSELRRAAVAELINGNAIAPVAPEHAEVLR
jgi:hypothetical protein